MKKHFITKVNNNQRFEISEAEVLALDGVKSSENQWHILHDNQSYKAELIASNFYDKTYTIEVNNRIYEVQISDDLDLLIKAMGFENTGAKHSNELNAPMPGLILEVYVEVGQTVKEDDPLLILEAMKMENMITSPRDGNIKSIMAVKGDAVEKDYLLIEFK